MELETQWPLIKRTFGSAFRSSFHYAIASVGEAGEPRVTPIGSLLLREPGVGIYFEEFTRQLPQHAGNGGKVCVLAVNSSLWFWLGSLVRGRFQAPPRCASTVSWVRRERRPIQNSHSGAGVCASCAIPRDTGSCGSA